MNYINNPQTLLVMRDGVIDEDYYGAINYERRKAALFNASKEALYFTLKSPIYLGKGVAYLAIRSIKQEMG